MPEYVTVGGVVSILTIAVLDEPAAVPVLPEPSVAVQLMPWMPSPVTLGPQMLIGKQ